MTDRFDVEIKVVLNRAREEAARLNHDRVRSEHILLALLRDRRMTDLLFRLGMTKSDIRSAVERRVERGPRLIIDDIAFEPDELQDICDSTLEEVDGFGHGVARNCHLLLGLLKLTDGVACAVLESFGTTLDTARHEVLEFFAELEAEQPGAA